MGRLITHNSSFSALIHSSVVWIEEKKMLTAIRAISLATHAVEYTACPASLNLASDGFSYRPGGWAGRLPASLLGLKLRNLEAMVRLRSRVRAIGLRYAVDLGKCKKATAVRFTICTLPPTSGRELPPTHQNLNPSLHLATLRRPVHKSC